ncbi:MAG: tRNA (adenosine(37)-N6)-threonylcarbamoyltransferase complex ATPase subunit type 1 TsaE [Bryobacterales bacterium]|nr:tRNA (adenosine(37)-N6)-threonylcarbamoyltransferase complex ATPase subunit type 1 TsaE [Bryobacterales bacterium]
MNSRTFQAATEEEMIALGERLAALLPPRALVFLQGDLGAGKTTLVKGIAKGLGAAMPEEVSSPTFTLIHEYGDPVRMYHIDLYRLDSPRQLATLGLDEIFEREAVVVVEWPEKFARWLPREHLTVKISAADTRTITVESTHESLTTD